MPLTKEKPPSVTVVMTVYNADQFLREAVCSILRQTYSDFELIVVDDASSDTSLAILRSLSDQRIRVITHETNLGASLSRNEALCLARGELIAIMDADDVCHPTRLERQVAFLNANPQIGLVGSGIYDNIDASGKSLYRCYLPQKNELLQRSIMTQWCFLHSSIMFRKVLYQRVGGYRKIFEPAEDHDFVLRIVEHCEAYNLYQALVSYRLNTKGLSVVGHHYVDELRATIIRLAQRRRCGKPEDLEAELPRLLRLKQTGEVSFGLSTAVKAWHDSLYAAKRFYGFGCRELCAGELVRARSCFVQSLRTNRLFIKSWIGLALSFAPFAASRLRFVFRASMQHHLQSSWLRSVSNVDVPSR